MRCTDIWASAVFPILSPSADGAFPHGTYAITTVGKINNTDAIIKDLFAKGHSHFLEMSGGDIKATELVAAIVNQKDNLVRAFSTPRRSSTVP